MSDRISQAIDLIQTMSPDQRQGIVERTGPLGYPWFSIVEGDDLQQGDILLNFPAIAIPDDLDLRSFHESVEAVDIEFQEQSAIVMTQTCDIVQGKAKHVLLCFVFNLDDYDDSRNHLKDPKGREDARRGNLPPLFLLNTCGLEGHAAPIRVADFRRLTTMPLGFVRQFAKKNSPRLRLLPPYREHLSQSFARFFMRVGLPQDIPSFK